MRYGTPFTWLSIAAVWKWMRYWAAFSPLSIDATLIGWDIEHLVHNYQQLQSKSGWDIYWAHSITR